MSGCEEGKIYCEKGIQYYDSVRKSMTMTYHLEKDKTKVNCYGFDNVFVKWDGCFIHAGPM